MQCPDEEMLAALIDGKLEGDERRRVLEHVATCGDCRDIVNAATDFIESEAPADATPVRFGRSLLPVAALAAAALLALLLIGPIRDRLTGAGGMESLVAASRSLEYRAGDG